MKITNENKEKRLNKKETNAIRVIYETTTKTNSAIAKEFGVLEGSIRYLAKKHKWKKNEDMQEFYEAEKIANKQKILNQFQSEQKQEVFKVVKSIADKEGEKLAKKELEVQRMKQEMMENAYKAASDIFAKVNTILSKGSNSEKKIEDVFYQGVKSSETKRTIIDKEFTPHDLEKLFNIARPLLETDGFLHKPVIALQNNIQNNINQESTENINIVDKISNLIERPNVEITE